MRRLLALSCGLVAALAHAAGPSTRTYAFQALLEKDIGERRPAYRDYIARTNAFIPGPPKHGKDIA